MNSQASIKKDTRKSFFYFPPDKKKVPFSHYYKIAKAPANLPSLHWKDEKIHLLIVFLLTFFLYLLTTSHFIALEDDALFVGNFHFWGVAHPPGYPIHTLLGGTFYHLFPFGSGAFRAHLFSGFAAAITCVAIYAIIVQLIVGRIFAYFGAFAYASSKTFWAQAIIAEVYTLNTLFFFLCLALSIDYVKQKNTKNWIRLVLIAMTVGLGLANHYPLFILAGITLAMITIPRIPQPFFRIPIAVIISLATTLPFYLWMVWRSHDDIDFNFHGKIDSLEAFWNYVTRTGYASVDQQAGVEWHDKLDFLFHLIYEIAWQFTPFCLPFIIIGLVVMFRSRLAWFGISMLAGFFMSSFFLWWMLNFRASFVAFAVFQVYPLIAYGIMAIWLAVGAAFVTDFFLHQKKAIHRRIIVASLTFFFIAIVLTFNEEQNNRSHDQWAHDLAMTKLESIEKDAILFVYDDLDLPMIYLHKVEQVRPDLELYSDQGLILRNRLFNPRIASTPIETLIEKFIIEEKRPIYYHTARYKLFTPEGYESGFTGFFRQVQRKNKKIHLHENVKQWLLQNINSSSTKNSWTRFQQYETISQLANAIALASQQSDLDKEWIELLEQIRQQNAKARILTNLILLKTMSTNEKQQEADWINAFNLNNESRIDRFGRGRFYLLKARLEEILNGTNTTAYEQSLLYSLSEDERPSNPGLIWLLDFYAKHNRGCDYALIAKRHFPAHQIPPLVQQNINQIRVSTTCPQTTSL